MSVPSGVLAASRSFLESYRLNLDAEVHRPVKTQSPTGGTVSVWSPVATGIKIGVASGAAGESQLQAAIVERFGTLTPWWILLPYGFDIRPSDRIYQLTPIVRKFEVVALPNKEISFELIRRVAVIEVT